MARGNNTADHPGRRVHKDRFGVGDTIDMPGRGPVTVDEMGGRYFTGTTAGGSNIGKTSIGLTAGESMSGDADPWKVQRRAR